MDILFSQVREDPCVELEVARMIKSDLNALVITSGGCTILSLLSENIKQIDAIDMNCNQNFLAELKVAMVLMTSDTGSLLDLLQGKLERKEYVDFLENAKKYISDGCYEFWKKNIDMLVKGINNIGKFEILFQDLVKSGFNYEKCFNRDNLISIFGQNAVINSLNKEFSDHFKGIVDTYKNNDTDNYFYHQILYGKYCESSLPPYFHIDRGTIEKNYKKINYYCSPFDKYIEKNKKSYNMIHVSNIFDWCNKDQIDKLLSDISSCLENGGFVIARRLNGDYNLKEMVARYFKIININIIDKSYFYSEVVIGQKIQ